MGNDGAINPLVCSQENVVPRHKKLESPHHNALLDQMLSGRKMNASAGRLLIHLSNELLHSDGDKDNTRRKSSPMVLCRPM
jgi:hypothetical protein